MARHPALAVALVGGMIDLLHAGVDAADDALGAGRVRHREQRADADHRQVRGKGKPLRHAAGDAQSGERAGAFAKRYRVQSCEVHPVARQQRIHHREQSLRM